MFNRLTPGAQDSLLFDYVDEDGEAWSVGLVINKWLDRDGRPLDSQTLAMQPPELLVFVEPEDDEDSQVQLEPIAVIPISQEMTTRLAHILDDVVRSQRGQPRRSIVGRWLDQSRWGTLVPWSITIVAMAMAALTKVI